MSRQKTLKRLKGRLKELEHLDIIEVKWVDAASLAKWFPESTRCDIVMCSSVGYYDGIHKTADRGDSLHLYGDKDLDQKGYARLHAIPAENIREFRVVSKGKPK